MFCQIRATSQLARHSLFRPKLLDIPLTISEFQPHFIFHRNNSYLMKLIQNFKCLIRIHLGFSAGFV